MDPQSFWGLAGVPVVIGLVQVVKASFPSLASHWVPVVTLGLSIGFNTGLAGLLGTAPGVAVLVGVVTGLSASGLYSYATVGK
jgi:hypothetical protein